ncbi:hypothetical protein CASFOL_039620 [Castilleja foliolosa]|uniref:Transcription factor Iwr1 domain-containing protein n=1 Tax=Castilleja foliolosa TaxID=1961234 RepID=A0ABD3BFR3_9LAMI
MAESSSAPASSNKPVVVRVKRKAFQSAPDAFWLEIHERPLKRPLLDFGKLSISDASSSRVDELKTKKILVRHVETVTSSGSTFDVLRSFVPDLSDESDCKDKNGKGKRILKTVNFETRSDTGKSETKARGRVHIGVFTNLISNFCFSIEAGPILLSLMAAAKPLVTIMFALFVAFGALSRNARFEQIWRSRKEKKEAPEDEAVYEMFRLYDVVRVDVEEQEVEVQKQKSRDTDLDDHRMMAQYLPLLRDVLPSAAVDIESDIHDFMSRKQGLVQSSSDGYVYDFYAVNEDANILEGDSEILFPLVQVNDDDEFYDGPDDSEYETDDSNAENNPLNDYPEEEISEDEDDEVTSRSSDEKSESESTTSGSQSEELENKSQVSMEYGELYDWTNDADLYSEDELHSEGDDEPFC